MATCWSLWQRSQAQEVLRAIAAPVQGIVRAAGEEVVVPMTNRYCEALGIGAPVLEKVKDHSDANTYSLLIVALLERGEAMTLLEVAERFAAAGVAPAERALQSLQRCKPARAPVYRDGDHYALDPHDEELDLWAFRLGLRPPRMPSLSVVRSAPEPLPGLHQPLTVAELDEAWRGASLYAWSSYRLALAVLDAHGEAMAPEGVVAFVRARSRWHSLSPDSAKFRSRRSTVRAREDGRWEIGDDQDALLSARKAVRDRVQMLRRSSAPRLDPVMMEVSRRAHERRRAAHAAELAALRRVLVHTFPANAPLAVVLMDLAERAIETFVEDELDSARERISGYDFIGAVDVRMMLRVLEIDPGERRLAELGPPQKSKALNNRGRTLKITTAMLVQGSCGIARPFGDPRKMAVYLREGQTTRFRRRLEADAKSLFALYEYGRLHGAVRLRWGFLDEMIPAPWRHRDESWFYHLKQRAQERGEVLEVVTGGAPGWTDPWARGRRCHVEGDADGYRLTLVDEEGVAVDDRDVQLARLAATVG